VNQFPSLQTVQFENSDQNVLNIDLYSSTDRPKGCLLFMHGGALLLGSRADLPLPVIDFVRALGWDVACGEYRFAPANTIDEIVSDVIAATKELRKKYSDIPLVLSGYSAGAYLTLLAGALGAPVDGLLAFAGYGDLMADWCLNSSQFFCDYKNVDYCEEWLNSKKPFTSTEERIDLYVYLRQKAMWSSFVIGEQYSEQEARRLSPASLVSKDYPKTVLVHGSEDCDVPASASIEMAKVLGQHGVSRTLNVLDGMGHDLFVQIDNGDVRQVWIDALETFVKGEEKSCVNS